MKSVFITIAVLLALLGGCWRLVHPPVPKDDAIVRAFHESRTDLIQVVDFCAKHKELTRIAPNFTTPEDVSKLQIPADDLRDLRRKMASAGFNDGVYITFGDFGPKFIFMSGGLVTGGVTKGLLYARTEPKPIKDNLDHMGWKTYSHVTGYRHIEGPWYVFFQRD